MGEALEQRERAPSIWLSIVHAASLNGDLEWAYSNSCLGDSVEERVEGGDGCARACWVRPDGVRYGDEVRAGPNQGLGIVETDAADGDTRRERRLLPDFENFWLGPVLGRLG